MILQILFFKTLEVSLSAFLIVILILLIRFLSSKVSNQKFIYCLWLLLMVKLILPVTISSPLSIENITDKYTYEYKLNIFNNGVSSVAEGLVKLKKAVGLYKIDEPLKKEVTSYKNGEVITETKVITDMTGIEFSRYASCVKFVFMALGVAWLAGFIICITIMIYRNRQFKKMFINHNYCEDEEILKIFEQCKKDLQVKKNIKLVTSGITMPVIYGVFNPIILLPYDCKESYNSKELRYILLHELQHYKQKDVLFLWGGKILKSIHWFNPVIGIAINKMEDDCEMLCDRRIMDKLKKDEEVNYGMLLLKQAELNVDSLNYSSFSANLFGKDSGLKLRIKKIVNYQNKKFKKISNIAALVCILILLFIFIPVGNLYEQQKSYLNEKPMLYAFWVKDNINLQDSENINIMVEQMVGENLENEDIKLINTSEFNTEGKYKLLLGETWPLNIIRSGNSVQINTKDIQNEAKKRELRAGKIYVVLKCDFQYTKYFSGSIAMHTLMDLNSLYSLDKIELN